MKKIFRLFVVSLMVALAATSCDEDDATAFRLYGFNPNPAVRGEALTFYGEGLSTVNLVRFVGGAEVTDITRSGNTISVTIPMTAQPGAIELCYPGGSYITVSALQLDEPLASDADFNGYTDYESKTNGTTVVGSKFYIETALETDYLSDIVKVEFAGDEAVVEFDEDAFAAALGEEPLTEEKLFELSETLDFVRSQHLVIVTIPETAKSGVVSIYNSNDDRFTGPEVTIAQSMAESVAPMTNIIPGYTELTIKGENFDLVVSATFAGDKVVELGNGLNVSADGKTITLQTVLGMQDGVITLHTKSGDTITTEAVETIIPSALFTSAEVNGYYKNGSTIYVEMASEASAEEINAILGQINGMSFGSVAATITANTDETRLEVVVPMEALFESILTFTTHAGKEGTIGEIELVEPRFDVVPEEVNGGESFIIEGFHLDLVSKVTIGDVECVFETAEDGTQIEVFTERSLQSGSLAIITTNGRISGLIADFQVNYVGEVMITSMPEKAAPGDEITIEGSGFNKVESVFLGASKVVAYTERSDARLSFVIPADIEAGEYNLTFNLTTGVVETSPQMITISGMKIVEQTLWEGSVDLAGWSGNLQLPADLFADCTTETQFTLHYENQGGGQFKIQDGKWTNLEMPDKSPWWEGIDAAEGSTSYAFTLNADHLAAVQSTGMVIGGQNLILTKLTILVAVPDTGGPEPVLDTDIMLNDYEPHGDHSASWDGSWADASATEFLTEDGNTYVRVCAPLSGWFVNCNHQATVGDAFGAAIDDISKYNLKFDLKIEEGVTGTEAVEMQVVLADGWYGWGANFFPATTDGEWITVTLDISGIVTGAVDCTTGTNGLYSNTPIPAGVCLDNLRLSLK